MNTFLASAGENYKIPSGASQFMKLQDGDNRIRVMTDAVIGWEGWKDNKPFRHEGAECKITADMVDVDPKYDKAKINHFWAFVVFEYASNSFKILEITQKSVMAKIYNYLEDADFGDPKTYDLVILKQKNGEKTEYNVIAKPPKPVTDEIAQAWSENKDKIDLQKLFKGEYPVEDEEHTS